MNEMKGLVTNNNFRRITSWKIVEIIQILKKLFYRIECLTYHPVLSLLEIFHFFLRTISFKVADMKVIREISFLFFQSVNLHSALSPNVPWTDLKIWKRVYNLTFSTNTWLIDGYAWYFSPINFNFYQFDMLRWINDQRLNENPQNLWFWKLSHITQFKAQEDDILIY